MMFRFLCLLPLVSGALFLLLDALLIGSPGYRIFLRSEIEFVKLMALVGMLVAATAFRRDEYLRAAWLWVGGSMFLLLTRDFAILLIDVDFDRGGWLWLKGGWTALANLSQVIGTWMLARAWHRAGMGFPSPSWAKAVVLLASFGLAGMFGGSVVITNIVRVASGEGAAVMGVASGLGDTISLALIAPLLLTALALRGGLLGWPWALLTVSYLMWLGYDAGSVLGSVFGINEMSVRTVSELFRNLACMYGFSAGVAQRLVVKRIQEI